MEARDYVLQLLDSGMTQSEIAARVGLHQPTISKVLRGDVRDVLSRNYRRLQALAQERAAAGAAGSASQQEEAGHAG